MIPVDSSVIAAVGYDDGARRLRLEYRSGRTYDYLDVPPEVYEELMSGGSMGEYVNGVIKPNYDCVELD